MQDLISAIEPYAKRFGPELASLAYLRGLAVTLPDGSTRPIPIAATPVTVDVERIRHAASLSRQLSSAAFKMAHFALSSPRRELLLAAMAPKERAIIEKTHAAIRRLACTRVDFFSGGDPAVGSLHALEINATIPAMQGYSDIAARSFIQVVGKMAGASERQISDWCEQNGSNVDALYRALTDGFRSERGRMPTRIALLCRRNDSQISELRFIAQRFCELGTPSQVVFPDLLSGREEIEADGQVYDLVYRHFFVRRLHEVDAPFLEQFFSEWPSPRALMFNPPAAQFEVKTTFALLSEAMVDRSLASAAQLNKDELAALRVVPWTRPFRDGPMTDPSGHRIENAVEYVASQPARFVLKRAWEYGGKAVFVGKAAGEPSFAERSRTAYGEPLDWPQLCRRAAEDRVGGGFVVQEFIPITAHRVLVCSAQGVVPEDWYVDFSAYASIGLDHPPTWGGVCRGSHSEIVNIVGGGGVLPLILRPVAEQLARALRQAARSGS